MTLKSSLKPKQLAIAHGKALRNKDKLPKTLPDALKRAVISSADKGVIYIQSDDSDVFQSYPELLEDAQKVLAGLRKQGFKPQDKVIFQLPNNQDFITIFWGCLLGGFVPVPMEVAPNYTDTNNAVQKLQNVWRMLDKPLIIVSEEIEYEVINSFKTADINNFKIKSCSSLKDNEPDRNWHHSKPEDLALLLLTSGSTGTPKGVQLSHRVILYRAAIASQRHQTHRDTVSINWLPLDHVSGIAQFHVRDIYSGCQQVHAPTEMFLQDPVKWLDWIDRYKVNISWSPNFAYGLVNKQSDRIIQGNWDLSSMQIFLNAGEAIAPQTARRFMELLTPHKLPKTAMHPAWGMSETAGAIVYSDRYSLATPDDQFVETGTPAPDLSIRIVDGENKVVSEGIIGTLQIKGEMVTSGYYQNPEANKAAFTDDGWFNTGDVAFIREGRLTIAGRRKDVIIINGLNYYCHEIEAVVEDIEDVTVSYTAACGFRPADSDTDKLVIFFHPQDNNKLSELIDRIRSRVVKSIGINPTHLIPVEKETIPKTGIGKIQRSQLKQRFEAGEFEPILKEIEALNNHSKKRSPQDIPSNNLTEKIAEIWQDVFGMPDIGYQDNFFELGGHSILATQLIGRLRKEFAIELSLQVLLSSPTVAELAAVIAANLGEQTLNPEVDLPQIENGLADLNEPFPLNDIQQAYWLGRDPSFELGNISTHAYGEMDCYGVDLDRLVWVIRYLIDHHPMLRAIVLPDGQQQILAEVPPYEPVITDLSNLDPVAQEEQLQATREELSHQVFATDRFPLFETRATKLGGGKTRLYLSLDLLIADASTLQTLRQQLLHLYFHPQPELPKMGVSFRDYVLAERALEKREDYLKAERYWFDRVDSLPPAPDVPLAVYPSQIDKPRFKRRRYRLEPKLWSALQKRGRRVGLTDSGILLTAFSDVLTLWNRRTHFTLNLTTFNRLPIHPQVNDLVGDFTYLTLLEVDFRQQMPFEARAQQLQQQLFADLDHRQCSGVQVLRELNRRHGGDTKITMPVIFTSFLGLPQKEDLGTSKTIDRIGEVVYALSQTSQAWIDHVVFEEHGAMVCCWDVVDALFPEGFMDDLFTAYCNWLELLATDETAWQRVERAHLLPEYQQQQRAEVNNTETTITDDLLHSLFTEQVKLRSQQTAVIACDRTLTYAELDRLARKLAHQLRQQGAKTNQMVAVILEKGWRQIVAVLGVLMSGAAYIPIDPKFPIQRQQQVLEQSQAQLVVSTQDWLDSNQSPNYQVLVLDEVLAQSSENLPPLTWVQKPSDLAYIIYTSGSTGKPKGVAIDHRGAVNTLLDLNRRFKVTPEDRVFALAALNFDLSVYDIFAFLGAGGTVVMPEAEQVKEPAHWVDLIEQHGVSILNLVPTQGQMLVEYLSAEDAIVPDSLRLAMLSADIPPVSLPGELRQLWSDLEIHNLGGATEASIWSVTYPIKKEKYDPEWVSIPYGKPMDNQFMVVLNEHLDPCPVWVSGDLYIGGIGLAQGYWQNPDKTAAAFIEIPPTPLIKGGLRGDRIYRTGDKARYLPDGNLEFLGREDNQVKIRGFRIELGEIESVFDRYPTVKQTVVHTVGEGTDKQLAAYVVCHSESAGNISEAQDPFELAGVIKDPIERTEFKLAQPGLRTIEGQQKSVSLPKPVVNADLKQQYLDRQSHRQFSDSSLSQATLKQVLSSLKPLTPSNTASQSHLDLETLSYVLSAGMGIPIEGAAVPKYRYPSAGNLYPVQVYVRVGQNAIANLEPGIYYYHRVEHCLVKQETLSVNTNNSDITLYLVGQMSAIEPMYGELAKNFCLLEAGYMSEVLRTFAESKQLYLQPQTNSTTDLQLDDEQLLLQQFTLTSQVTTPWVEEKEALEVYLYLKPELDSDLSQGMYRYHPSNQNLEPVSFSGNIEGTIYGGNQNIFETAGLSLFFVEADSSLQDEALLMAGRWGQALMTHSPQYQMGWCPLGRIEESKFRAELGINPQQRIVHNFVGGAIAESHPQTWFAFEAQESEITLEEELQEYASLYLPDYMTPTYVVQLEKIPVSPNGKVDRKSLPIPNLKSTEAKVFVAPKTPTQEIIAKLIETALKIDRIGLHDNIFEYGANSLTATQIVIRLRKAFGIEIPLRLLFESPTVAELDRALANDLTSNLVVPPILPIKRDGTPIPLSYAQERFWFLAQLEDELSTAYNGTYAFQLDGYLNVPALQQAIDKLVCRHQILQTTFPLVNGTPVQHINPDLRISLQVIEASSWEMSFADWLNQETKRLFDLSKGTLLRLTLVRSSESKNVFVFSMHHIISDGWSIGVLLREFSQLYQAYNQGIAPALSPLPIQYADYTLWQRQWLQGSEIASQLSYWQQQLASAPALLNLPTDYPRPERQTFQGRTYIKKLPLELSKQIDSLARQQGVSLFMTLLAAFQVLLYRYSGQSDVLVGTPIANRQQGELESLIGSFANTLVMRVQIDDGDSVTNLLHKVRKIALEAYSNQDAPFEQVVEAVQTERSAAYSPLFQVMFVLQNTAMNELSLPGMKISPLITETASAKFDLTLSMEETKEGMKAMWEYNSDLFEASTIDRMVNHWEILLKGMVKDASQLVAKIPLLSETEQEQLLVNWNSFPTDNLQGKCIHQLFEEQVVKTPDGVAIVWEEGQLTYSQLNQKANQLAHYLQGQKVASGLVGVYIKRSPEIAIALLGILKAGLAYLPLEPTYPQEYVKSILSHTSVSVVLSKSEFKNCLPENVRVICLDSEKDTVSQCSQENLTNTISPESKAYVVYANRKAVSLNHNAIALHLDWFNHQFDLCNSDVVLHQTNLTQSSAIWEIFGTLVAGGKVAIAPENNNQDYLQHLIASQQVSLIHFVPSELSAFLDSANTESSQLNSLRRVFCSGELLSPKVRDKYYEIFPCSLTQLYGLPETAGEVIYREIDRQQQLVNVFPINTAKNAVYVLDKQLQPVPMGVTGEIHLGGLSTAQGYLQATEATAPRFIDNPFAETPLFKTNQLGKIRDRGYLELLGSDDRQIWIKGFLVSLSEIEAKLYEHSSVKDCYILMRKTNIIPQLVAYVVTSGQFDSEQLQFCLKTVLPSYMLPSAYVPLSSLPLTDQGQIDEAALKRLPVIDSDLVQQWSEYLQSLPEIDRVAVVVVPQTENIPPVHLRDLLLPAEKITPVKENKPSSLPPEVDQQQSASKKLAIVHGETFEQEADAPHNLTEVLQRAASQNSTHGITYICDDGSEFVQSYEDLREEAQRILAGLRKLGLQPQDKVIFQLERMQDFIPAFWGCILGGFVPVPISIPPTYKQVNSAVSKLQNAWQMLDKPIILAGENSADEVRSVSELLEVDFQVEAIADLRANQPDINWNPTQPDDLAILLLTSGSTGTPKAVMQSHRSILSRSVATARMNNFTSKDVSLNWFPLDHVGGLVMFHIRDVYLGCQQIQAHTELVLQQPLKWLDLIDRYRATITWAPNFAYGAVVAHLKELSNKVWDLSSMRFILNAGEAIVAKSARRFLELLALYGLSPNTIYPSWGMSETASAVIYSHNFSLDSTTDEIQNVEVGMPIPGFSVRIVNTQDRILAEGIIGKVQVKGSSVTSGYYQNPEQNQEAFTDDGWFNSGDLGLLSEEHLTITGREKNVIIINGLNYYAHEIEAVVEEIEGVEVSYTAAVAVRDATTDTDKLAIFFNSSVADETELAQLIKTIRTTVVQSLGINPDYLLAIEKESIPKTSIGKIQRSRLGKQFLAGEFEALIKKLDLLLENSNTLPNWFYQQVWQPKEASTVTGIGSHPTLIFLDSLGLGTSICQEFAKFNQPYIQVEAGTEFVRVNQTCYQINPQEPEHYQSLFNSILSDEFEVAQILHLWTYNRDVESENIAAIEQAQITGIYSLLYLVQALSKLESKKSICLQVVSSNAQWVNSADNLAYQKAPILGLIKTIAQEMPWLSCRHVDLENDLPEVNIAPILNELQDLSADTEVAYRNQQRLVSRLAKAELPDREKQPIPFQKKAMYLITGGLGGVGLKIAKYLLQNYQARLLLVGRTPLEVNSKKNQSYQELAKLGGEVSYQAVDICDRSALQQVVDQAKSQWGQELAGIIHLAGIFQERLLVEETQESIAAVLRPKLIGTWVLNQLLDREGIFINFSSVNGFFGGSGVGAYAAANSFIDAFAKYQKHQTAWTSYCFAWSMWNEMGMSRGYKYKDLTNARGFAIITPTQGLNSFLAGLHHNQAQLLIGLDGSNSNLQRQIASKSYGLQKLTAHFTTNNHVTFPKTEFTLSDLGIGSALCDRFGTKSHCDLVQLEVMPLTETGEIDRRALPQAEVNRSSSENSYVPPKTEIETKIAAIWQEVLKIDKVGIFDNFFDLGGNSLLIAQVQGKLATISEKEISILDMFLYPTIRSLAEHLISNKPKEEFISNRGKQRSSRKASMADKRKLRQMHRKTNQSSRGN